MKRKASAVWLGGLKDGKGTISTDSGVLANTQYSFSTRFEDGAGTNPEELIAAAHAACFSMALSNILGQAGLTPDKIETTATISGVCAVGLRRIGARAMRSVTTPSAPETTNAGTMVMMRCASICATSLTVVMVTEI